MLHFPFADIYANLYTIVLTGVFIGITGGFFGISGSFLLMPVLTALGFPATFAVGTNLAHLFGKSVLTTVKNNALKQVNWKLGIVTGFTGAAGVHLGRRIILSLDETGLADSALRVLYIVLLSGALTFMLRDHIRSRKGENTAGAYAKISAFAGKVRRINLFPMVYLPHSGGKSISLWILVALGVATGLLSGVLGISGSFIRLPALVFLTGLPILPALCTDLLATALSLGCGAAGFAFSGHVEITAALLLLIGSAAGSHIGYLAATHVNRIRMTPTLFANVALVLAGVILGRLGYTTPAALLMLGSVFTLGSAPALAMIGAVLRNNRSGVGYSVEKTAK
jgi:hypothetical protein